MVLGSIEAKLGRLISTAIGTFANLAAMVTMATMATVNGDLFLYMLKEELRLNVMNYLF